MNGKKNYPLAGCIVLLLVFSGCKKYQYGPGISFRSKEARLCGAWNVHLWQWRENYATSTGELRVKQYTSNDNSYSLWFFNQNDEIIENNGQQAAYNGTIDLTLDIDKNGAYTLSSQRSGQHPGFVSSDTIYGILDCDTMVVEEGKWEFTGKHENLVLSPSGVTTTIRVAVSSSNNAVYNGLVLTSSSYTAGGAKKEYVITELKNKTMRISRGSTEKVAGNLYEQFYLTQ